MATTYFLRGRYYYFGKAYEFMQIALYMIIKNMNGVLRTRGNVSQTNFFSHWSFHSCFFSPHLTFSDSQTIFHIPTLIFSYSHGLSHADSNSFCHFLTDTSSHNLPFSYYFPLSLTVSHSLSHSHFLTLHPFHSLYHFLTPPFNLTLPDSL